MINVDVIYVVFSRFSVSFVSGHSNEILLAMWLHVVVNNSNKQTSNNPNCSDMLFPLLLTLLTPFTLQNTIDDIQSFTLAVGGAIVGSKIGGDLGIKVGSTTAMATSLGGSMVASRQAGNLKIKREAVLAAGKRCMYSSQIFLAL